MNEEVRESPTIRFDARKQSVNAPTQNKATFVNYKNKKNTNSCGKMKVYKVMLDNNKNHQDQHYQINGNPQSFIDSFKNQTLLKFDINEAIKSLSPRKEAPKVIKKNKIVLKGSKPPSIKSERKVADEASDQLTDLPLEPLTATIKKEKTQMKKSSRNKAFSKTENIKFQTVNDRILQNCDQINQGCTIYFQDNREMTVVNIVNQGTVENQTISKVKAINPMEIMHRNHVQNTPYFGQKRSNVYSKINNKDQRINNEKESDFYSNDNNLGIDPKLLTFHNEKGTNQNYDLNEESDEDQYNEESFYDIQTESEAERMKHTSTTKGYSSFKSNTNIIQTHDEDE